MTVRTELAATLPPVKATGNCCGAVLANLIDNAAEAMEGSAIRRMRVATRVERDGDAVESKFRIAGKEFRPRTRNGYSCRIFRLRTRDWIGIGDRQPDYCGT